MKLNPKWLVAAVVTDSEGNRIGTVSKVSGDNLSVLCKGKEISMSAKELDANGQLKKPNASAKKYI